MLETIIASSVLIAVLILLRYFFKGKINLRLQYALWLLVAVRLLMPFSIFDSSFSILNIVNMGRQAEQMKSPVTLPQSDSVQRTDVNNAEGITDAANISETSRYTMQDETNNSGNTSNKKAPLGDVLYILWLVGAIAMGLWFILQNIWFYTRLRKTREAVEIPGSRLPVYLSRYVKSPCLFGFLPAIYLHPNSLIDAEVLKYILAHEETHYRHGDHLWSYLRCVCLALHWFNPLVWRAAVLSRRDCEIACDESTLNRIGDEHRKAYGNTLINMIERRAKPFDLLYGATTMTSGKSGIKERITMIAKKPKMLLPTLLVVILILAAAVGCTFTGANGNSGKDVALYERGGVTIAIPNEYEDQLLIDPVGNNDETTLIRVYQKSAYEKNEGMGFLFSIVRYTEARHEQFLSSDGSGQSFFAKDETSYYGFFFATDVQAPDNYETFSRLFSAVGDYVKSDMITRNGLTPYSDHPQATPDSFSISGNPASPADLFAASTGNIHDYMPDLLAGKAVSDYDLLPCLENFTHATWSELEKKYGNAWFDSLWGALRDAAVSNRQADSDDQTLRDYYIGKAYLVADGAYTEGLTDIVLLQWENNSSLYSACLDGRFSAEEATSLRRSLTYSISYDESPFGLYIPGSERSIYLSAYPVDFPFGCDLTGKSRETYRAESFGQVTVVESDGLQVTYLNPAEGVYTVITLRADKENYAAAGVTIGDKEESLFAHWPDKLKKLDGIRNDDEAWFGSGYDHAYAYTPEESTKSVVYLIKDGLVSGIEIVNGLDGAMY